MTAWLSHAKHIHPTNDRMAKPCSWPEPPTMQLPSAAPARKCASCCSPAWRRPGRCESALSSAPARAPSPAEVALDQVAGAPRLQRGGRPPSLDAGGLAAAAARRGARASRSKLQGIHVRPCLAGIQLAPPRARALPPPQQASYALYSAAAAAGAAPAVGRLASPPVRAATLPRAFALGHSASARA